MEEILKIIVIGIAFSPVIFLFCMMMLELIDDDISRAIKKKIANWIEGE